MLPARTVRALAGAAIALLLVGALASFTFALSPSPRAAAAGDCTADPSLDSEEQAFLTLINNHRATNSLPPLAASYTLSKAAQWKSQDMGQNTYFAHDDLTRTWVQRIRDCGYGYGTWLGENIAAGISSAQAAFDLWKNSAGHNANMLGSNYAAIGIGRAYVAGSPYGWYWTTDFGGVADGWPATTPVPSTPTLTATGTATATRTSTWTPAPSATPTVTAVPDTAPPSVSISNPPGGGTVSGAVAFRAVASDGGSGVQKVRFWVDNEYLGFDSSAAYGRWWDTRLFFNSAHVLKVQALDNAGNSSWAQVTVTVANADSTPPSVILTAPTEGATVAGNIALNATASDVGTAVSKVRFWVDGVYLGYDSAAPYTRVWNSVLFTNGAHVVKAQAVDNANNGSAIVQVAVTVSN